MLCVALIVVFIQFYYYDVTDMEPLESFNFTRKADVLRVHNGRKFLVYSLKDLKLLFPILCLGRGRRRQLQGATHRLGFSRDPVDGRVARSFDRGMLLHNCRRSEKLELEIPLKHMPCMNRCCSRTTSCE